MIIIYIAMALALIIIAWNLPSVAEIVTRKLAEALMKNLTAIIVLMLSISQAFCQTAAFQAEEILHDLVADIGRRNLNKGAVYVAYEMDDVQRSWLSEILSKQGLDKEEVDSLGRMILQKSREGNKTNLENIDMESLKKYLSNDVKLKGYMAESLSYSDLKKQFPESQGYTVQYSKPSSKSTDIMVMKDGKPIKFYQVKFWAKPNESFISGLDDTLQFYGNKPALMDFEIKIPKDQIDELVKTGRINADGKVIDLDKFSAKYQRDLEEVLKGEKYIKEGSKTERYLPYKNNPDKIRTAISKVRFKPMSQNSAEIISFTEKAKSAVAKIDSAILRKISQASKIMKGWVGAGNMRIAGQSLKVMGKFAIPIAVTAESLICIYTASQIEQMFEDGLISEFDRDIEHGANIGRAIGNLAGLGVGVAIFAVVSPTGPVAVLLTIGVTVVACYALEWVGEKVGRAVAQKYHEWKLMERERYAKLADSYYSALGIYDLSPEQIQNSGLPLTDKIGFNRAWAKRQVVNMPEYRVEFSPGYLLMNSETSEGMDFILERAGDMR